MRSLWLAKKRNKSVALKIIPKPEEKRVDFEIIKKATAKLVEGGTVTRSSATCPICGYTTPATLVRRQLSEHCGGGSYARLFVVVTTKPGQSGRCYRLPNDNDEQAARQAAERLDSFILTETGPLSVLPDESMDVDNPTLVSGRGYGI